MNVLVDTSIWSLALRRKIPNPAHAAGLGELIHRGSARLIGPILQELLSGIREQAMFERVRSNMRSFPQIVLETEDFEEAARFSNTCRERGVQGSNTDFLICAVAERRGMALYTDDKDFKEYARFIPLKLHRPR